MEWYYIIFIISICVFAVQTIINYPQFTNDFSLDDLISVRSITHFVVGFTGWLVAINHLCLGPIDIYAYCGAFLMGFALTLLLFLIAKLVLFIKDIPNKDPYIGLNGTIIAKKQSGLNYIYWIRVRSLFGLEEMKVYSSNGLFEEGDVITINDFIGNRYII